MVKTLTYNIPDHKIKLKIRQFQVMGKNESSKIELDHIELQKIVVKFDWLASTVLRNAFIEYFFSGTQYMY